MVLYSATLGGAKELCRRRPPPQEGSCGPLSAGEGKKKLTGLLRSETTRSTNSGEISPGLNIEEYMSQAEGKKKTL